VPWTAIKPDELNPWMADFVNVTVPGGESFKTMHQRCQQFWNELIGHDIKNVVIITHAGFIRSILSHILEIPLNKVFQLDVDYGSVTKITASGEHGSYQQVLYINR
jgi:alpha-ribazole phosphatase